LQLAQAGPRGAGSGARSGSGSNRARRDEARKFYQEGNAHFEAQRYQEAVFSYKKALDLEPHFAPIYYNLGVSQMVLGDKEDAVLNLERYLELRPNASNAEETRTLLKTLGPVDPDRRRAWQLEADSRESRLEDKGAVVRSPETTGAAGVTPGTPLSSEPSGLKTSKRILAVLPWRMLGSADKYPQLLSGDLSKALKESGGFESLFSVYDSDYSLSAHLSKSEMEAAAEQIWPGTSHYSRSRQFNSTAACEIGRKLGAKVVLIGYWEVTERGNDIDSQDLQLHLIDVSTGKVTTYSDRSRVSIFMGSFKPYLRDCVVNLLRQYARGP
jgi:tetratricopeptide (TPR) repeat protein